MRFFAEPRVTPWPTRPTLQPTRPTLRPTTPTLRPAKPTLRPTRPTLRPTRPTLRRRGGRAGASAPAGFVLMEAVIALAIISLVSIALLSMTGAQVRTAAKAKVLLTSRALAEDRLDAIRLLDYEDLADLPDSLTSGTFPPPFETFTWTAHVEEMEDEYDLFGAEVVVDGGGESFPLRTLIHSPRPVLETQGQGGPGGSAAPGNGGRGGRGGRGG